MSHTCKYCYMPFNRKDNWFIHEQKRGKTCRLIETIVKNRVEEVTKQLRDKIRNEVIEEVTPMITEKVKSEFELDIRTAVIDAREKLFRNVYDDILKHCKCMGEDSGHSSTSAHE